ncbi:NAD(P)H-dependent oxidoreductase [Proteus mirabilis]|uniref:NAD(P)H-dependent oxidoreductase n=1 Tax=Proteus mirabilis TaxID=584 RepID=UPI0028E0A01B|nr:NAD(P)H-dependent oxidoreductase [Proteus mirabilis]
MKKYKIINWQKYHQNDLITLRDLAKDPIPILDQAILFAFGKDTAIYNFSIFFQLKHSIDFIARAGETFKYTETGSVGLLEDKQVIVLTSRGGIHKGQPSDLIIPYLTQFLSFIGINNIQFILTEGTALGEEYAQQSHAQAQKEIDLIINKEIMIK